MTPNPYYPMLLRWHEKRYGLSEETLKALWGKSYQDALMAYGTNPPWDFVWKRFESLALREMSGRYPLTRIIQSFFVIPKTLLDIQETMIHQPFRRKDAYGQKYIS